MGLKHFSIQFTRCQRAYFAGEIVQGKICIETDKDKRVEHMKVHFHGSGRIFSGLSTARNSSILVNEVYFDKEIVLIGKEMLLTAGEEGGCYEFPFQFQLPYTCPSSFEEPFAQIKYGVQATMDRPNGKSSHSLYLGFTVNGIYDLNKSVGAPLNSMHLQPAQRKKSRRSKKSINKSSSINNNGQICTDISELSCLTSKLPWLHCIQIQPVGFNLKLSKNAFVPGEFVHFCIEIFNASPHEIQYVTLSLFQESKYQIPCGAVKSGLRQRLCTTGGPIVAPYSTEIWETNQDDSLFLQIPSVPPTNLGQQAASKIVQLSYYLVFEMEVQQRKKMKEQIPIVIGNIPIKSTFNDFIALKKNCLNSTGNGESVGVGKFLGYPDLCDPTFEDAFATNSIPLPPPMKSVDLYFVRKKNVEDDDSDDEYYPDSRQQPDSAFIPKYANYTSICGLDLVELNPPSPEVMEFARKRLLEIS